MAVLDTAIQEFDYPNVSANFTVMAALRGGHPEKHRYFSFPHWMAVSSPAMTAEPKFAVDSVVSSLSGNIWLIKSRRDRSISVLLRMAGPVPGNAQT
jgi:hypothetical protein